MDALNTVERISDWGMRALLLAALFGGYFELWYYGPWVRRQITEHEKRCGEWKEAAEKWERLAVSLLQTANNAIGKR